MSMFIHTVTIYNVIQGTDKDTFQPVETLNVTILRGVMLQASKGANVRKTGLHCPMWARLSTIS